VPDGDGGERPLHRGARIHNAHADRSEPLAADCLHADVYKGKLPEVIGHRASTVTPIDLSDARIDAACQDRWLYESFGTMQVSGEGAIGRPVQEAYVFDNGVLGVVCPLSPTCAVFLRAKPNEWRRHRLDRVVPDSVVISDARLSPKSNGYGKFAE
jgi:hypothetical protein